MRTKTAIKLANGRDALARLLNVETITTYHWKVNLPFKHERYLRAIKPHWFDPEAVAESPPPELRSAVS
jgi:hypothetical protein